MSSPGIDDSAIKVRYEPSEIQAYANWCYWPKEIIAKAEYVGPANIYRPDLTNMSRPLSSYCIRGSCIASTIALVSLITFLTGMILTTEAPVLYYGDEEEAGISAYIAGGTSMLCGTICCIASCIFGCKSFNRREKVRKDLEQNILPEAKNQAAARINALSPTGSPPPITVPVSASSPPSFPSSPPVSASSPTSFPMAPPYSSNAAT